MVSFIELLKVIFFGVIEGVTEWLPISSTGHMILADEFVKLNVTESFWNMFLVVIQLGAILAVICLFFHKLNPFSPKKTKAERHNTWVLWFKVIVAVLPSVVLGLLLDDWMEAHLLTAGVVAAALIIYGVFFLVLESRNKKPKITNLNQLSYKTALLIGMFQVLSLVPGTSRSGSTILGAILLGCSRTVSAEFSFFLAIPTMIGASGLKLVKYGVGQMKADLPIFSGQELILLLVGMAVAFAVSLFVIRFLMNFVKKHDFKAFGWYRIALGILVILYFAVRAFMA